MDPTLGTRATEADAYAVRMRTLAGWRLVSLGRRENRPATATLGWLIILYTVLRRLFSKRSERMLKRTLKPGQGLVIRVAGEGHRPPKLMRRIR